MTQEIIAAIIVACASFVVIKRFAPRSAKHALLSLLRRVLTRMGWNVLAIKIGKQSQTESSCASGCGKCGTDAADSKDNKTFISLESLKRTIRRQD